MLDKAFIDEFYHQLRLLYLHGDIQEKEAIAGIVSHLTQPDSSRGDYTGLVRFLAWYGSRFLLNPVFVIVRDSGIEYDRVVELGAGLAWLGRGVARLSGNLPALFVDKRQWPLIDIIADIESTNGVERVLDELKPKDLIVMGELLHCLDDPAAVMGKFSGWPMVAVEYYPTDWHPAALYKLSRDRQLSAFGCQPVGDFTNIFSQSEVTICNLFPYVAVVAKPRRAEGGAL